MRNFARTLAPEKFNARITVHSDGSCSYSFDGTLVFAPALIQANCKKFDARTEARLGKAADLLKHEGFDFVSYFGEGRYSVSLARIGVRGAQPTFVPTTEMRLVSIRAQSDGSIAIGWIRPAPIDLCQLSGIEAAADGALQVTVGEGVKVLRHNPAIHYVKDTLVGAFNWRAGSTDTDPLIVLRPPGARLEDANGHEKT